VKVATAAAIFVLAGATVGRAQLYSNVLVNPGFESGTSITDVTGWYRFNNCFRYSDPVAHGGSHALSAFGNWWPTNGVDWNASGAYQQIPAAEGQIYEGSVWGRVNGSVTGVAFGALILELYDSHTNNIFSRSCATRIDSTSPTASWFQIKGKVRGTRNTAFIRFIPVFLQSPAFDSGAVWFDDASLYQVETNYIDFAGRRWEVWDWISTPGENFFGKEAVFTDSVGRLHLRATQVSGVWHSAALQTLKPLGFGEYRWHLGNRIDLIDSNLVVGLFTYAQEGVFNTNQNEVDIEFSRAFPGTQTNWLVYTIQPYTIPGNSDAQTAVLTNDLTTHRFIWHPDEVHWQSYYGHTAEPEPGSTFGEWRFPRRGIPIETNELCVMNFWLFYTNAPHSTQNIEYIVNDFVFIPFDGFLFRDDFDDNLRSNAWELVGTGVEESNQQLVITPPATAFPAGYVTTNTIHRNERGTRYVFSAQLATVSVTTARAGEDVRAVLALSAATNSAWSAACAATLQARYDVDAGTLTLDFFTKTNAPGADGTLHFEGVITNLAGGVELRFELEPSNYVVCARDSGGGAIAMTTNVGASSGAQGLREALAYGYWFVGAQNSAIDSAGTVYWDRATVGIGDQAEQPEITAPSMSNGSVALSFPGAFDARYGVYKSATVTGAYLPVVTGLEANSSCVTVTDAMTGAAGYYRVEM